MAAVAEVLVVGAGIVGASTAYALAKVGVRTTLLDRGGLGSGASPWGSGLVRVHYPFDIDQRLAVVSREMFRNWAEVVGGDCYFRETGFAQLVGPESVQKLHENVRRLRALGARVEVLDAQGVRRLQPEFVVDDVAAAAYEPDSGFADQRATVSSLVTRARQLGATVVRDVRAEAVLMERGRVVGVQTSDGAYRAGTVVLAAGIHTKRLAASVGVDLPLRSMQIRSALLEPHDRTPKVTIPIIDDPLKTYYRPDGDHNVIVGVGHVLDVDPDDTLESLPVDLLAEGAAVLARRIPAMADCHLVTGWAGIDTATPDRHPLIGPVAGVEGLVLAVGGNGTTFKVGPALGQCLAEIITEGASRTVDVTVLRPGRFVENAPVTSDTDYGAIGTTRGSGHQL